MKQKWVFAQREDVTTEEIKRVSGSSCTHVIHKPHLWWYWTTNPIVKTVMLINWHIMG
jgi:hypothetical protein